MAEAVFVYLEIARRDGPEHLIGQLLEDVWAFLDELKQGGALQTGGPFCKSSSAATPGINTMRLRRPAHRHDAHGDLHDSDDDIESDGHFMIVNTKKPPSAQSSVQCYQAQISTSSLDATNSRDGVGQVR